MAETIVNMYIHTHTYLFLHSQVWDADSVNAVAGVTTETKAGYVGRPAGREVQSVYRHVLVWLSFLVCARAYIRRFAFA